MTDPRQQKLNIKPARVQPGDYPAELTYFIVAALQALERGDATPDQQKRALEFIIGEMSGAYKNQFRKDARETDFALGRAFVGQQIVGALKVNLAYFIEKENRNASRE